MASYGAPDRATALNELQLAVSEGEQDLQVLAGKLTETELRLDDARNALHLAETRLREVTSENGEMLSSVASVESRLVAHEGTILAQSAHIARLKTQVGRPVRLLVKKALRPLGVGRSKS